MKQDKPTNVDGQNLRGRAEEYLAKQKSAADGQRAEVENKRLLHELQVHQIELEMQNEELRKSREQLEGEAAKYADLYDFAPVGYFALVSNGKITRTNLAGGRLMGIERSELVGRRFGVFLARQDLTVFNAFLQQVFATDSSQSCEVALTGEARLPVFVQIEALLSPDKQECCMVVVDITGRKLAEIALREKDDLYSTFINATDDMAFLKDENFRYLIVNRQNAAFFGKDPEEIKVRGDFDFMPEEAAAKCRASDEKALQENCVTLSQEIVNGRVYEIRKFPVTLADGRKGLGGFIRDITEQRKAEEKIRLLNDDLERRVTERTAELNKAVTQLQELNRSFVGREIRMAELKERIAELEGK